MTIQLDSLQMKLLAALIAGILLQGCGQQKNPVTDKIDSSKGDVVELEESLNREIVATLGKVRAESLPQEQAARIKVYSELWDKCSDLAIDIESELLKIALSENPSNLRALCILGAKQRNKVSEILCESMMTKKRAGHPSGIAWIILWGSKDLDAVLSKGHELMRHESTDVQLVGHSLLSLTLLNGTAPSVFKMNTKGKPNKFDRTVWDSTMSDKPHNLREVLIRAWEARMKVWGPDQRKGVNVDFDDPGFRMQLNLWAISRHLKNPLGQDILEAKTRQDFEKYVDAMGGERITLSVLHESVYNITLMEG